MRNARSDFPDGFVFGTATAAYQVEGSGKGGAGTCHWDTFAATPGNVVRSEDGRLACDHYTHWSEDLDLLANGNFDAYRFSISWPRILPEGRGTRNDAGLDFYDRLVDGMLDRGLQPHATLYHWDLPSALADLGGWTNRDVAGWFADYAAIVAERLGDRLTSVATINEPWCVSWLSHFEGHHAPGLRDIRAAARSMHHVLLAHGHATRTLREIGQPNLGIVLNFEYAEPASDSPGDQRAAATQDAIYNRWFIEALTNGRYPDLALEGLEQHLPKGWHDDMASISAPIDWLGVNYYTRSIRAARPDSPWPATESVPGPLPKTQMDWEIYPEGLYRILKRLHEEYTGDLPLFVTENGMALDAGPHGDDLDDHRRIAFIDDHLDAMRRSIAEGVPLRGFFYWSLLDNFEWAFGYEKRFGIVHVDFDTLKRRPKASYQAFAAAIERH